MAFAYPVALDVTGRRCVVVGGGSSAEEKVRGLLDAGARVVVVAERFTSGLEELGRRREIELVAKRYCRGDLGGAFLVIATEWATNGAVHAEATESGVLMNAVDDIHHCDFAAPSVVRRGDLVVAISTGGKAPALAKHLRRQLANDISAEYGVLVDLLAEVRSELLAERAGDFATWARGWERALEHDLVGLVRQGRVGDVKDIVRGHVRQAAGAAASARKEACHDQG